MLFRSRRLAARPDLGAPVSGAGGYLRAEVVYACTHEGALHLDDVLARRTRTAIEVRDRGLAAAGEACGLMAAELGWTAEQTAQELASYSRWVTAQLAGEREPDDEGAYRALSAVDATAACPPLAPLAPLAPRDTAP